MKTASVRELRNNFHRVAAWMEEGETVEITKSGKVFARLVPAASTRNNEPVKPDILARLKKTWGARIISIQEATVMRAAELEGDEG